MTAPTISHILIDETQIQQRIHELGQTITADYMGVDELVLICVLKGGMVFMSDLMRSIQVPHMIDCIRVSSYGLGARHSSGQVALKSDINLDIRGKHVLVIEDIIDTGHTLAFLEDYLAASQPASLACCTLLDKPSRREVPVDVRYIGFSIPDEFVVGYGIDADERFRHLPYIAAVAG